MQVVSTLRRGELLLALISGGGSSSLSLPVPQVSMPSQSVTRMMLASGAPIGEMNVVRKHLSQIAGGRLAAAAAQRGAHVIALMISTSPATRRPTSRRGHPHLTPRPTRMRSKPYRAGKSKRRKTS